MKLEAITYDDVIEEAYDAYNAACEDVGQEPHDLDAGSDTPEVAERLEKGGGAQGARSERSSWR